ncbi:MAG: ATP-binding cassette domain-containing protein [Halorhodospira sp.]
MSERGTRSKAGEPLVRVEGVAVAYGARRVLDGVSLDVQPAQILTLVGSNGAGKTTLLRVLIGLTHPVTGQVQRAPGLRIGYVPQQFTVDAHLPMTVRRFMALSGRAAPRRWQEVVADTGVAPLLEQPLQALSGGEMRRALLARALLQRPALLALDEPAAGLDERNQGALYRLIGELRERYGCAVVIISHDLNLVMAATDEVLCLRQGRIACRGAPASVMEHPEYQRLFGAHLGPDTAVFPHAHGEGEHGMTSGNG